jgi:hypothetical protein
MLEGFVDKVKGREPRTWITPEDSIEQAEWVDKIYEKVRVSQYTRRGLIWPAPMLIFLIRWSYP